MPLRDLQDDRRPAKPWLPQDDRDVTNGLVTAGWRGSPRCVVHGQMHRIDPVKRLYRCSECGVGAYWPRLLVTMEPLYSPCERRTGAGRVYWQLEQVGYEAHSVEEE